MMKTGTARKVALHTHLRCFLQAAALKSMTRGEAGDYICCSWAKESIHCCYHWGPGVRQEEGVQSA